MRTETVQVVANVVGGSVRKDYLEGREHFVVPIVMMTEGVRNGSKGPIYYSDDFLKQNPESWNFTPIVVYHPKDDGVNNSARTKKVLNESKIGVILNNQYKSNGSKRWAAEAWIDVERSLVVDKRVNQAVSNGESVEVSTGLTLMTEQLEESAEFGGIAYNTVAVNYIPDHLAVLPDEVGACSSKDGCGLTKNCGCGGTCGGCGDTTHNVMSHSDIYSRLAGALRDRNPKKDVWIESVYDGSIVVYMDGNLYSMAYTISDDDVSLDSSMIEVKKVTEYRTVASNVVVGNSDTSQSQGDSTMNKTEKVKAVINSGLQFTAADEPYLATLTDERLDALMAVKNTSVPDASATPEEIAAAAKKGDGTKPVEGSTTEQPAPLPQVENKAQTAAQYIANAPAEVRDVLNQALKAQDTRKKSLVETITANAANQFTPEFLATQSLDVLEGMATLANAATLTNNTQATAPPVLYTGATGSSVTNAAPIKEEPLLVPRMEFGQKAG